MCIPYSNIEYFLKLSFHSQVIAVLIHITVQTIFTSYKIMNFVSLDMKDSD